MANSKKRRSITGINAHLSYLQLRKLIGLAGLALVFTPLIAGEPLNSISHSFDSPAGVMFICILAICGTFLIIYQGPGGENLRIQDHIIAKMAGISLLAVAFIPTGIHECERSTSLCTCFDKPLSDVHLGAATLFFILMGFMFIFRFTKGATKDGQPDFDRDKKLRNIIYRVCGICMWVVLAIAGMVIYKKMLTNYVRFVYWTEVLLLVFFGISWLVKGNTLVDLGLQDDKNDPSRAGGHELTRNVATKIETMEHSSNIISRLNPLAVDANRQA